MADTNRRDFTKVAMLGAGAAVSAPLLAQAQGAAAGGGSAPPSASRPAPPGAPPLAPPDKQPPDLKLPQPQQKTGYAIVGLGVLAVEEVLPAFGQCEKSRATALVSGHPDKARQLAQVYGVAPGSIYDYGNFDRIRDDAGVQVVYIILPNSMHAEYTVRALEAGKHVLCEKPMATSAAECQRMIAAARAANRKLMIAYRLHYEPHNMRMAEMCRQQALGRIKTIASSNCQTTKAPNIRLSAELGGGPVSDTGIYSINGCRMVTGEEPVSVTAVAHYPADDLSFREVPESVAYVLRYPSGIVAHCDTSFGSAEARRLHVHCADGVIELDPAFSYRGLRLAVRRGNPSDGEVHVDEVKLKAVDHFVAEMDHFSECVQSNKAPRTPGEMGLADVRIVEAVNRAIKSGASERVG